MEPKRKEAIEKLENLKQAFTQTYPGVTNAFDLAEAALVKAVNDPNLTLSARELTKLMLLAIMDAGFMIMHKDEIHNSMLAAAQAGKILRGIPERKPVT